MLSIVRVGLQAARRIQRELSMVLQDRGGRPPGRFFSEVNDYTIDSECAYEADGRKGAATTALARGAGEQLLHCTTAALLPCTTPSKRAPSLCPVAH
jgi:hypothetical protein